MQRDTETKQLHIEIPSPLYDRLKEILPERGMITSLIRRFLQRYITAYNEQKQFDTSPSDKASESIINEWLRR